jgi:iron(III) transport system substrate-binding protein
MESPHSPPHDPVPRLPRVRWLPALLPAAAAALLLLASCGGSDGNEGTGASEPETEGITLYSGRIAPLIGPAVDLYEADVDRDVQVRFGDSAPLASTIIEEGDNSPADAFFAQDAGSLGALEDAGLLEPLPQRILELVPPRFRSDGGRWVGVTGRARVIAYNPDRVEESELPDSPLALTGPEWSGRVGWAPSNASFQAYVTALRLAEGDEVARTWLEGMVANGAQEYPSNVPIRDAIASGEVDVGLINHYYVAQAVEEQGEDYPVRVHFPPSDLGSLINVAGVGVLASSDRKEEAFGFVEFMLSPPAQEYFAASSQEYPLARGAEPDGDLVPLREIPAPEIDLTTIADLEGTLELMREAGAL